MPGENVVVRFEAQVAQFNQDIQKLIAQLREVQNLFDQLGRTGKAGQAGKLAEDLQKRYAQVTKTVNFLIQRIQALRQLQAQGAVGVVKGGAARGSKELGIAPHRGSLTAVGKFLERDIAAANDLMDVFRDMSEVKVGQQVEALPAHMQQAVGFAEKNLFLQEKINDVLSGRNLDQFRRQRLQEISKREAELAKLEAAYKEGALQQLPSRAQRKAEGELRSARAEEKAASRELNQLRKEETRLENKGLRATKERNFEKARGIAAEQQALADQIKGATQRQTIARNRVADSQKQARALAGQAGIAKDLQEIEDKQGKLAEARAEVYEGGGFEGVPGTKSRLTSLTKAIAAQQEELKGLTEGTAKHARARKELGRLVQREQAVRQRGVAAGLPDVGSVTQAEAQAKASLTRLRKTMIGAFQGFGRRFEATLQFAISGALIFGAQRLVREFIQAAVEVERAFADIQTALEFDIEAGRFTKEFELATERLRREILLIANEFNVLPTEANKAAFVMVARFGDTENALKALRAQLLATKVSGIDQSEVLRALTAVAEGFAGAVLRSTDAMTLQQKLFQREAIAAELYAKALDLAVFIQQKFGVETEDVLEGTARATEVFKLMGFTMEETAALVTAVSRQLGQTGQQAAERLVRSIGQLTSPKTRDSLLELAAASDEFSLSITDFGSGQEAWEAIADQFERIQRAEPGVAAAILQIVGQRREAEAVAAALGTIPLQQQIVGLSPLAEGSAERRFGFLAETVQERVKSIAVAFQELAQNVERLGFLTPIKGLLAALEGLFVAVNTILKVFQSLFGFLDNVRIGDLGLGQVLANLLAVAVALKSVRAIITAGIGVAPILSAARARAAAGAGVALATKTRLPETVALGIAFKKLAVDTSTTGTGLKTIKASLVAFGAALRQATVASFAFSVERFRSSRLGGAIGRGLGRGNTALLGIPGYAKVSQSIKTMGAFASTNAAALGKLAGAAGILIGAFIALRNAGQASKDAIDALADSARAGRLAARQEAIEDDLSPAEEGARAAALTLEDMRQKLTEGANVMGYWSAALANVSQGLLGQDVTSWISGVQFEEGGLGFFRGADTDDRALIKGSREWWEAQILAATKAWGEAQVEVIAESLRTLPAAGGPDDILRRRGLASEFASAVQALGEAETDEEINAAVERIVRLGLDITDIEQAVLDEVNELEGTAKSIQRELARTARDISLGRISRGEAAQIFQTKAKDLRDIANAILTKGPEFADEAEQYFAASDQALLDAYEQRKAVIDRQAKRDELLVDEGQKLYAAVVRARRNFVLAIRSLGTSSDQYVETWVDLLKAMRDAIQYTVDRAVSVAEQEVGLARTTSAKLAAIDNLIAQLRTQQNTFGTSSDEAEDIERKIQGLQNEQADITLDELRRLAIANAKLGGPIRNRLNAIRGEIQAVRTTLASGIEGADLAEARVELAELLLQESEEQIRNVSAQLLAQAGAADVLAKLNAQLAIARAELDFVSVAFGENTAEWYNARLAIEEAQRQIALNAIELDILGQRLSSDITNPYQQAVINLSEVLAKLADPNLGELERKRLEAEAQTARASAEASEINQKLFDLKFLFETDQLGLQGYKAALEGLLAGVDTGTQAGKEAFLKIQGLIDGLTDDASDMAFNVPTAIRMPTIFEVRRALAADQLGVNYQDNRQQDINVFVRDEVDMGKVLQEIEQFAGGRINVQSNAFAPGNAGITMGSV